MKRKPLILAIALLLVVGAALWGVNYRLDHPPLTKADKEFRALVAGADSVYIYQYNCQPSNSSCLPTEPSRRIKKTLRGQQMRDFVGHLRLTDAKAIPFNTPGGWPMGTLTELSFQNKGEVLAPFRLSQTPRESLLIDAGSNPRWRLNPRFEKPLRRTLDQIAPQRLRS